MTFKVSIMYRVAHTTSSGLIRVCGNLQSQRPELSKQKPRAKTDENFGSEVSRLEPAITLARARLETTWCVWFRLGVPFTYLPSCQGGLQILPWWPEGRIKTYRQGAEEQYPRPQEGNYGV